MGVKFASLDMLNKLQIELSQYIQNFSPLFIWYYLKRIKIYDENKIYFIRA